MDVNQQISINPVSNQPENIVTITDDAYASIMELMKQQQDKPDLFLRLFVQGAGCSGVNFGLALDTRNLDDDTRVDIRDVTVVIDKNSYPYAEGATIDFVDNDGRKGFKITSPGAALTDSCGSASSCGGSC